MDPETALRFALALHLAEPASAELAWFHRHRHLGPEEALRAAPSALACSARFLQRLRELLLCGAPRREEERALAAGLRLVHWNDSVHYPPCLRDLAAPPAALYLRGAGPWPPECSVTIVGSRRASRVGLEFARRIAAELARRGATVVSGMALGIDRAAHRGGLDGGGPGIAVLASGLDYPLPSSARPVAQELARTGALLSEMSLRTAPLPAHFPRRNRILAALSAATIVVEADQRSGSLITVHRALDLGREVWAVPGDVDKPTSRGTNELLRDGARPLIDLCDLDSILPPTAGSKSAAATLDPLLAALAAPKSVSALSVELRLARDEVQLRLIDLELEGRVTSVGGGVYRRSR